MTLSAKIEPSLRRAVFTSPSFLATGDSAEDLVLEFPHRAPDAGSLSLTLRREGPSGDIVAVATGFEAVERHAHMVSCSLVLRTQALDAWRLDDLAASSDKAAGAAPGPYRTAWLDVFDDSSVYVSCAVPILLRDVYSSADGYVSYSSAQSLTAAQAATARANISAASSADVASASAAAEAAKTAADAAKTAADAAKTAADAAGSKAEAASVGADAAIGRVAEAKRAADTASSTADMARLFAAEANSIANDAFDKAKNAGDKAAEAKSAAINAQEAAESSAAAAEASASKAAADAADAVKRVDAVQGHLDRTDADVLELKTGLASAASTAESAKTTAESVQTVAVGASEKANDAYSLALTAGNKADAATESVEQHKLDTSNPHSVTAAQAGAVSNAGGKITGSNTVGSGGCLTVTGPSFITSINSDVDAGDALIITSTSNEVAPAAFVGSIGHGYGVKLIGGGHSRVVVGDAVADDEAHPSRGVVLGDVTGSVLGLRVTSDTSGHALRTIVEGGSVSVMAAEAPFDNVLLKTEPATGGLVKVTGSSGTISAVLTSTDLTFDDLSVVDSLTSLDYRVTTQGEALDGLTVRIAALDAANTALEEVA